MYLVKNKTESAMKYRDTFCGKTIILKAGETIKTEHPPQESSAFEVTEEKVVKKVKKLEVDE